MRFQRALQAAAVVLPLAVAPGLVACGGGDDYSSYCDAVTAHRTELSKQLAQGEAGLLAAIPTFEDLRDQAPADIRGDWSTLVNALSALRKALDDAGVKPSEYHSGKPPSGVSPTQQKAIAAAATKVGSAKTQAASQRVQQQARDVCHTPLTLG